MPALRAQVRAFLREATFVACSDPLTGGFDPQLSAGLGARGWVGMTIPTTYGGPGATALERYVVAEELLAAGAPVAAHWTAERQMAPSLLLHASEHLKRTYLPQIAAGTCWFAIGLSEPDAGSDLAAVRTRAERVPGGWRLSGVKVWTSLAPQAHVICVLARTSPAQEDNRHAGLSQLLVPLDAPGVTVHPIDGFAGDEVHFGEVVFDEVFVPESMLLGTEGGGWAQATSELAYERSGPDRFLSVFGLLDTVATSDRGRLLARLWALRQAAIAVNAAVAAGAEPPNAEAVMVKDRGTVFENDLVDAALDAASGGFLLGGGSEQADRLAHAQMSTPIFTIRGGTTQILRGIVARSLGVR